MKQLYTAWWVPQKSLFIIHYMFLTHFDFLFKHCFLCSRFCFFGHFCALWCPEPATLCRPGLCLVWAVSISLQAISRSPFCCSTPSGCNMKPHSALPLFPFTWPHWLSQSQSPTTPGEFHVQLLHAEELETYQQLPLYKTPQTSDLI